MEEFSLQTITAVVLYKILVTTGTTEINMLKFDVAQEAVTLLLLVIRSCILWRVNVRSRLCFAVNDGVNWVTSCGIHSVAMYFLSLLCTIILHALPWWAMQDSTYGSNATVEDFEKKS